MASGPGIVDLLQPWPVKAGQLVHVPAGTLHAIGEGITLVEVQDGLKSASVQVRYTGYRLSMPVERSVNLTEEWTRDEATGVWTVKLDIEKLRDTMIGVP